MHQQKTPSPMLSNAFRWWAKVIVCDSVLQQTKNRMVVCKAFLAQLKRFFFAYHESSRKASDLTQSRGSSSTGVSDSIVAISCTMIRTFLRQPCGRSNDPRPCCGYRVILKRPHRPLLDFVAQMTGRSKVSTSHNQTRLTGLFVTVTSKPD